MKFPFTLYRVVGHSMEPTLKDGQMVWVNNWAYLFTKPRKNHLVIATLGGREFVKRVKKSIKDEVYLVGDNPKDSLDSREFGAIKINQIRGKVVI